VHRGLQSSLANSPAEWLTKLTAPELGNLAIAKVSHEFGAKPSGGCVAFHGFNRTGSPDHYMPNRAKIFSL
jgi:hypothetical protein